jgi:hypothetical protein
MSDGERVQKMIYEWLGRNYPDGPSWYDRTADAASPVLEIRMIARSMTSNIISAMAVGHNFCGTALRTGSQIIDVAKEGYVLIDAPEQSNALETLRTLCERDERECGETIERSVRDDDGLVDSPPYFAEFTAPSYSAPANDWEPLFYDKGIYEKRLAWLAMHEARVRKAIGMLE